MRFINKNILHSFFLEIVILINEKKEINKSLKYGWHYTQITIQIPQQWKQHSFCTQDIPFIVKDGLVSI